MFADQINSTSLTRDDTGENKIQRYTPWGETRTDGNLLTDHTYTGQVEDLTTGLRFYNARYQDPVIGRFVSADDRVPAAGSGQFYNRYTYNLNNPINFTDSSGHEPEYAQNCYLSPATCAPPATAVTADELALSTDSGDAFWTDVRQGLGVVVDALPGDTCVVGTPSCDPNAGWPGAAKRDVVGAAKVVVSVEAKATACPLFGCAEGTISLSGVSFRTGAGLAYGGGASVALKSKVDLDSESDTPNSLIGWAGPLKAEWEFDQSIQEGHPSGSVRNKKFGEAGSSWVQTKKGAGIGGGFVHWFVDVEWNWLDVEGIG